MNIEEPSSAENGSSEVSRFAALRAQTLKHSKQITIASVSVIAFLALAWWLWPSNRSDDETEAPANVVVSVRAAKAQRQTISAETSAVGTIIPKQQATVSAKISAPIVQMGLLKNKLLREGEVIAVLESRDLRAQLTEAKAALEEARLNLTGMTGGVIPQAVAQAERDLRDAQATDVNARATYERRRELYERGGISKKDLEAAELALTTAQDQLRLAQRASNLRTTTLNQNDRALAEARLKQAEERVASLEAQLSYATIRAPFTGIVTDQFQYRGEFAAAGARLVTIADTSEVIVKAPFADTVAAQLKAGDPAVVRPDGVAGEALPGRVSLVSRASDPANRSVEVWVNLANQNGKLRAFGAAQITLSTREVRDAVVVPVSALTLGATTGDRGIVMIVDSQSIARERKVTVGVHAADRIEITSGLKGGETVVIEGGYALPDGAKVQVSEVEKKE